MEKTYIRVIDLKTDNHFSLRAYSFPSPYHKKLILSFLTAVSAVAPVELENPIGKSHN